MIEKLCQSAWRYITTPIGKTSNEFALEIKEELTYHIEQRTRDFERQGFERSDAEAAAIAKFDGNGRIELPYFQAGDAFTVLVQTDQEWLPFEATVPIEGEIASIRASKSL